MSEYLGSELQLFEQAKNWKTYFASYMRQFLRGDVLEVGAGIGGTTRILCDGRQKSWICLEPDEVQVTQIKSLIQEKKLPSYCKAVHGTLKDLKSEKLYDAILYIDVIEHIENDSEEVLLASTLLKPNGFLIILVPAHQWLYSNFDKAIGHYRRYNARSLSAIMPDSIVVKKLFYLDSVGTIASLFNKYFLKNTVQQTNN